MSTQMHSNPSQTMSTPGRGLTITGFVLAALAVFFFPPVFGIAGAICGGVAYSRGDKLGMWAVAASVIALVVGMALGMAVFMAAK